MSNDCDMKKKVSTDDGVVLSPNPQQEIMDGGDVIPLQYRGIEDNDFNELTPNQLLLHAIANMKVSNPTVEGGYTVRHGT